MHRLSPLDARSPAASGSAFGDRVREASQWPRVPPEARAAVLQLLDRDLISEPGYSQIVQRFENDFAAYHGCPRALAFCNGTAALHAAYWALGLGPGDEVLIPTYTYHAACGPLFALGARPVFCEITAENLCLDPADAARRITRKTRALYVVHIWGNVASMGEILELAAAHGLAVIEDVSHAYGARFAGRRVGSLGAVGCFSMQSSKVVAAGEGGMAVSQDEAILDRMFRLGFGELVVRDGERRVSKDYRRFFKHRPHTLGMAVAHELFRRLEENNAIRRRTVEEIDGRLARLSGVESVLRNPEGAEVGGYYGHFLRLVGERAQRREEIVRALNERGLQVKGNSRYPLLHQLHSDTVGPTSLPRAESLQEELIGLPVFTCEIAESFLGEYCERFAEALDA